MSLQHILKHIYNHGTEEVIIRGKKIFLTSGVKILHKDEVIEQITFRVSNDIYRNFYTVTVNQYTNKKTLNVRCKCPYNMGTICRHEAAALFYLNELITTNSLDVSNSTFDQKNTIIRMKTIEIKALKLYASEGGYEAASEIAKLNKLKIQKGENEIVEADLPLDGKTFNIKLKRNDDKTFNTSCNCKTIKFPLCIHKTALFIQLLNNYGESYFDSIRNWDAQKEKLLSLYGYSLKDNLIDKFEFYYKDGKPFLRVLDPTIKKVNQLEKKRPGTDLEKEKAIASKEDYVKRTGVVINLNEKFFPYFKIDVVVGTIKKGSKNFQGVVSALDTGKYVNLALYHPEDRIIIKASRKTQRAEMDKYIARNSPFGDLWTSTKEDEHWSADDKKLFYEYTHARLKQLLDSLGENNPLYVLPKGKALKTASLKPISYSKAPIEYDFQIKGKGAKVKLNTSFTIDNKKYKAKDNRFPGLSFFLLKNVLFIAPQASDLICADLLESQLPTDEDEWNTYIEEFIIPFSKSKNIKLDDDIMEEVKDIKPSLGILLNEQGNYFILRPMYTYHGIQLEHNDEISFPIQKDGKIIKIFRDKAIENEFFERIKDLHKQMRLGGKGNQYLLDAKYALKENWFYKFFSTVNKWGVDLFGYEDLKKFKFRKEKPKTQLQISSQMDWFDTEVKMEFGEQRVNLKDIQKSLNAKQNFVKLNDGSLGLLPEEWLKKYSLLFKMADVEEGKLKVKKVNFHIIDELYDAIDQEDIKRELEEKKENLLNVDLGNLEKIPVPDLVQAEMRPYQTAGYHWFNYLRKVKWGGLLADDMGLGKTLQALSMLQKCKIDQGHLQAMVVCPTTLLFNWENEINKFTPNITYYIHHGSSRTAKQEVIEKYDVIITTYGTLRSDINFLLKVDFDYVVLDESQAIKNPSSKTAKAAMLLNTKNKIALSGTPMQNNTFDIYSQMNFLNPGMLGSREFFQQQFAVPIDKFQEKTAKDHLRKLIYPFLLRRTKEQVAKDLPEKTEITLTCEMGKKQMQIYNQYKNLYRSKILGELDTKGLGKSQLSILQGLMRLRQICDSPSIIKNENLAEDSIKLDELVREMQENVGNHKVLVFSQFLGMLALIRKKLTENEIDHEYFDGSYTTTQREKAIERFQNDEKCRVFVISLKAGGMGLNLTAADYVYIMDPWWNPAVEQQAIDRTHRIGQTKNIFAYRFICKDTVEEKIMKLKKKKDSLVRDIISDDTAFVKNLSRADIEYLFE